MVLSMLLFGGETLHYFALALTIGILFGIYSSVFVAAAIAMWLGVKREDLVKHGARRRSTPTIRTRGRWCRVEPRLASDADTANSCRPPPTRRHWPRRRGDPTSEGCSSGMPAVVAGGRSGRARRWPARSPSRASRCARRDLVPDLQKRRAAVAARHDVAAARRAAERHGSAIARPATCRCRRGAAPKLTPGRRRHHRARDPQLAPGAGHDGPRVVGVHRPALAHDVARRPRRARRQRRAAAARARAHRHRRPGARAGSDARGLARAAGGAARRVLALRRRGLSRDQPLADRAPRAARGRPAAVHPALAHAVRGRQRRGGALAASARASARCRRRRPAANRAARGSTPGDAQRGRRRDAHDDARRRRWRAAPTTPKPCSAG